MSPTKKYSDVVFVQRGKLLYYVVSKWVKKMRLFCSRAARFVSYKKNIEKYNYSGLAIARNLKGESKIEL